MSGRKSFKTLKISSDYSLRQDNLLGASLINEGTTDAYINGFLVAPGRPFNVPEGYYMYSKNFELNINFKDSDSTENNVSLSFTTLQLDNC